MAESFWVQVLEETIAEEKEDNVPSSQRIGAATEIQNLPLDATTKTLIDSVVESRDFYGIFTSYPLALLQVFTEDPSGLTVGGMDEQALKRSTPLSSLLPPAGRDEDHPLYVYKPLLGIQMAERAMTKKRRLELARPVYLSAKDESAYSLNDPGSDAFQRVDHTEFLAWLDMYVQSHPKCIILSPEKFQDIKAFLKIQSSKKKGAKNQFGSAQFRHWVRKQGFSYRKMVITMPDGKKVEDYQVVKPAMEDGESRCRLVVSQDKVTRALWNAHVQSGKHVGTDRTRRMVTSRYYGVPDDVIRQYVKMCKCQEERQGQAKPKEEGSNSSLKGKERPAQMVQI